MDAYMNSLIFLHSQLIFFGCNLYFQLWYTDLARTGFYLQVWKMKGEKRLQLEILFFSFWACRLSINMRKYIRFLEWFLYFPSWGQISKVIDQCIQDNWSWQGRDGNFHRCARTLTPCAVWQQVPFPGMCWEVCEHERPHKMCQRTKGVEGHSFSYCPQRTVSISIFFSSCSAAVQVLRSPLPAVQAEFMDCSPHVISKGTSVLGNAWLCKHGILRFTLPDDPTQRQLE